MTAVRADQIKYALSKRHADEVFLTEVKNGPSWTTTRLRIFDAFSIKKSWTKPCFTGYEIKVSRQDFLRDEKWPNYLPFCHRFYFACPVGLIDPDELPKEVGLVTYNPETRGLHTKKTAIYRPIEPSPELLLYIIMNRIPKTEHPFFNNTREELEAWVADKEECKRLRIRVKSKLMKQVDELTERTEHLSTEVTLLQHNKENLEKIENLLNKFGITTRHFDSMIGGLQKRLSQGVPKQMEYLVNSLQRDVDQLAQMVKGGQADVSQT